MLRAKKFIADHPAELVDRIYQAATAGLQLPSLDALATVTPELQAKFFAAAEKRRETGYLQDPIEWDPQLGPTVRRVSDEVFAEIERELNGKRQLGTCHRLWMLTKERLSKDHNITWYSPAEMNPGSCFD